MLFNELIEVFLEDEKLNPISENIKSSDIKDVLNISLKNEASIGAAFISALRDLMLKSPKSSSKLFFNQLFGGRHSKAVLGDLLAVFLNNSMATYKIAGPQVAVEKEILSQAYSLIGFDENAGGTFPTGGSMSNFMSLVMARDKVNLEIMDKGISQKLVAYTSENSHYSIAKNASFTGIGRDNIRYIKSIFH